MESVMKGFNMLGICLALALCGCNLEKAGKAISDRALHQGLTHYAPAALRGAADGLEKVEAPARDVRPLRQAADVLDDEARRQLSAEFDRLGIPPAQEPVVAPRSPYALAYEAAQADGKPLAIWIGAEWCKACKEGRPLSQAKWEKSGAHFVALDYDHDDPAIVQPLLFERDGQAMLPQLVIYTPAGDGWAVERILPIGWNLPLKAATTVCPCGCGKTGCTCGRAAKAATTCSSCGTSGRKWGRR
jgi:thiol-disulfide isomerase/thioredoxin